MADTTLKITSDVLRADGQQRVTSTTAQGGVGAAVVVVGEWAAQQAGWDGSLPTAVSAAMIVLLASAAAIFKHRAKLRA